MKLSFGEDFEKGSFVKILRMSLGRDLKPSLTKILKWKFSRDLKLLEAATLVDELNPRVRCAFGNVF